MATTSEVETPEGTGTPLREGDSAHPGTEAMGLWHAVAIGVGGMIGAGIFSVLGVAAGLAGAGTWISFLVAGGVAMLCAYSFGKLASRYPSAGGPVEFLLKGFGDNVLSGGLNLLLWMGYVLALALYARAFAGYGVTVLPGNADGWVKPTLAVGITALFLLLNVAGARAVGKAELAIVAVKVAILGGFVAVAAPFVRSESLLPAGEASVGGIAYAGAVVFLAYEGFGLITNAAEDMRHARRNLPRALMLSVGITVVVYVLVSAVSVGTLSPEKIVDAQEYALAAAARPALGQLGFTIIAVAALFSTASAINATLYGGANVSYMIAEKGSLPGIFKRRVWQRSRGGLLLTAALVAALAVAFRLEGIAMMGSAAFLLVYGGVQGAHLRLLDETGARRWLVVLGTAGCGVVFIVLVVFMATRRPHALLGLGALLAFGFLGDWVYRRAARRISITREP